MPADGFNASGALALRLMIETYCEVLQCVIKELKIDMASDKINQLLHFAKTVSFTNSDAQAQQLFDELMS